MSNDQTILRNPTALLVLRVWMERGSALPLRAYIRKTTDLSRGFQDSSVETDVEVAVDAVRAWLQGLLDAEANGDVDAPPNGRGPAIGPVDGRDGGGPATTNGAGH